jgi:hypothetical protein
MHILPEEKLSKSPAKGKTMQATVKEEALHAITSLPENATLEDIMYRLYVIDKINQGREAVKNGETLTIEELKAEIQTW